MFGLGYIWVACHTNDDRALCLVAAILFWMWSLSVCNAAFLVRERMQWEKLAQSMLTYFMGGCRQIFIRPHSVSQYPWSKVHTPWLCAGRSFVYLHGLVMCVFGCAEGSGAGWLAECTKVVSPVRLCAGNTEEYLMIVWLFIARPVEPACDQWISTEMWAPQSVCASGPFFVLVRGHFERRWWSSVLHWTFLISIQRCTTSSYHFFFFFLGARA